MSGSPDAAPTPVRTLGADAPPKVGDRVRVVVEGEVRGGAIANYVGDDMGTFVTSVGLRSAVSVEVLTPPAPTYECGDVVFDARGNVYRRGSECWYHAGWNREGYYDDADLARPLTLIGRAGKPVTP